MVQVYAYTFQVSECDTIYKGRCNFEHGICNSWSNDITDTFDWSLSSGRTASMGTGPGTDHTTRTRAGNEQKCQVC